MQRFSFVLLLAVLASIALYLNNKREIPAREKTEKKISGAYQALNFMADRQTYPLGKLPEKAYSAAWESMRVLSEAETPQRNVVEPWESIGPHNRGGRTLALAFNPQNPNTMYAGSASGGLWRSYTGGVGIDAWQRVETNFPAQAISYIATVPEDSMTMYIGTGEVYNYYEAGTGAAYRNTRGSFGIGILKTTDGGVNWEKSLDWPQDQNHGVWAIKVSPSDSDIIYAATTEGVYKTTDGGENWTLKHSVVMANDLLVHPDNPDVVVVGCGNLGSPGRGIYKTTDGGENWSQINSTLPSGFLGKILLGMAPSQPNTIYASIGNGFSNEDGASWLCRSDDFGSSWTIKNTTDYSLWQGWFSHDVAVNPNDPDKITVIGINVWNSSNGGTDLTVKTNGGIGYVNPPIEGPDGMGDFVHSDAHDVVYHPTNENIIYIASDGGIHRSVDGGNNYSSCNGRYQTAQFYNGFSTSQQDPSFCMGGLQDNGTIRWNGDKTWSRVLGGDGSWSAIHPTNDDEFYVSWQYLNIVKTIDGGDNLYNVEAPKVWPYSFIAPYAIAPSDGDVVYATSSVIAKSTDGASNWEVTNNGSSVASNGTPVLSIAISHQNPDVVYAATAPLDGNPSQVVRTLNGNTWMNITHDLPNRYPMDMAVDPTDDAIAYVTFAGFGSGHVFKTTDHGSSWEDITGDLPDVPTNAVIVDPIIPNNIYVGNDLGIFVSQDGGSTWEAYQEGLPMVVMVFDLQISPIDRMLRVATHGNGAYQRDLIDENVSGTERQLVKTMDVKVYPNPVVEKMNIDFEISEKATVSFQLTDEQGRMVYALNKGVLGSGDQHLEWEVNTLPKGVYFLLIKIGDDQISKKILIQ
jgi:photosystem II stability/assembly factor-like uncharacterized protein